MNSKKLVIIVVGVTLLSGLLIAWLTPKPVKTGARFDVVPSYAQLIVDQHIKTQLGTKSLDPGEHKVKASGSGFATSEVSFRVSKNQIATVNIALVPNSDKGRQWLKNHPEEVIKAEGFAGNEFDQNSKSTINKTPLVASLPFIDQLYRVDYGKSIKNPNGPSAVAIYITYYSESGKQEALDWIRFKGYDPAELEIVYESKIP